MSHHLTVKEMPRSERPYEKAEEYGVEMLSDAELLAVILRTGSHKRRSIDVAYEILNQNAICEGLLGLCNTTREELMQVKGIGKVKAIELLAVVELAKRISKARTKERFSIRSPESVASHYMEGMRHKNREQMVLVLLNGKNKVIKEVVVSQGTVNSSPASPREVFLEALKYGAVQMILLHNHPSGDPTPSRQDIQITKRMKDAGELLGIPILDHIIIGDCCYVSLREEKLL